MAWANRAAFEAQRHTQAAVEIAKRLAHNAYAVDEPGQVTEREIEAHVNAATNETYSLGRLHADLYAGRHS